MRRDDGLALRVDHPHGGASVRLGQRARRNLQTGRRGQLDAAGDSGPQPHSFRRIGNPDFDLKRPGSGIGLGRHFPHAAGGSHLWVIGEGELDQRVARACPNELFGNVEDGVASALLRELHDHLPGVDDFARFGAHRGNRAGGIGGHDRVAQLILRDAHLRLSGVDLGLGRNEGLLGFIEFGAGRQAMLDEVLLSREGQPCLSQRRLGRREVGLRRLQRILLVLWVKPGDDLARREHIAHVDGPLDHPSVEAKGEVDLVLGANLPCQRNGLAFSGRSTVVVRTGRAADAVGAGLSQPAMVADDQARPLKSEG